MVINDNVLEKNKLFIYFFSFISFPFTIKDRVIDLKRNFFQHIFVFISSISFVVIQNIDKIRLLIAHWFVSLKHFIYIYILFSAKKKRIK